MPKCVFAANKSLSGGAAFFKLTRDNSLLVTVFKQVANDQLNKKGNFDFKNGINVMFNDDEIGGFVRAVRTDGKFNFYHETERDGNKSISKGSFNFFSIEKQTDKGPKIIEGFGLTVNKNNVEVKVSLSLSAAESLAEFLKHCLTKVYETVIADDDQKDREYLASKKESAESKSEEKVQPKKKVKEVKSEPEPEAVLAGDDDVAF